MRVELIRAVDSRPNLRDDLIDILLPAFRDDPLVRGVYPADLDYVRHFPALAAAFARSALAAGTVALDPSGHGAAVWFAPGAGPDTAAVRARLRDSLPARRFAFTSDGLEILGRLRPAEPHWYLPWLGVLPEAQGAGIGTALLAAGLVRADFQGIPVYAEATTRRSVALYARHGFETWARMTLPGCPEIVAMRRPPRDPSAPSTDPAL